MKLFIKNCVYITMGKTYKITVEDRLKMHRKAMRENTHTVKPMVTTDKKKEANKNFCKNFKINDFQL